jgi:hypothetical protein
MEQCVNYLVDNKPDDPRLALAEFLFAEHERDRVTEELESMQPVREFEEFEWYIARSIVMIRTRLPRYQANND